MKNSQQFIEEFKTKHGETVMRDGRRVRDVEDRELMKRVLERYPGERENIVDVEEYLGESAPEAPAKSDAQQKLDAVAKSPSFLERVKNRAVEGFGDVVETIKEVGGTLAEGAGDIKEIVTNDNTNLAQKLAGVSGEVAGTATEAVGEATLGAGKALVSQETEDKVKQITQDLATKISENDTVEMATEKAQAWYNGLDEDNKVIADSLGGIGSLVAEVTGLGVGAKGAKAGLKAVGDVADVTVDATKPVIKNVAESVGDTATSIKEKVFTPKEQQIDEAVKRIIQPTGKTSADRASQLESAKRTLSEVDIEDAKDYAGLKESLDARVSTIAKNQDEYLKKHPEKYKPDQLGTYTKVGDETVITNPVQDALDGLENAYKLSGDMVEATKVKQLKAKMEAEGLDVSEINQIARDYNIEFKNKAFDAMGNPKAGFNAENYEAVRKGVKKVARDRLPDDASKELDAKLTDTYETRNLIDRLATQVDKASAKARKSSMLGNLIGSAVNIADLLSARVFSNALRALANKSGVLQKNSLNVIEIQEQLQKNLKKFQKLNEIQDPKKFAEALEEYLEEVTDAPVTEVD